jgi:hypothetical protein
MRYHDNFDQHPRVKMTQLNYGINCEDHKKALKLEKYIASINIVQDGLDVSEERVSVISNQHLILEIEKFSKKNEGSIRVEVWNVDLEFDEAESEGKLEIIELEGKVSSKISTSTKLAKFKSYSGDKSNIAKFKSWLAKLNLGQFAIISEWVPEVEYGTYGIEFECEDPKFDKIADKEWMSKGIITEKLKK